MATPVFPLQACIPIALILLTVLVRYGKVIRPKLESVLSSIANVYLHRIYCYKDAQGHSLPSAPYVFPDGQGNRAKFLHGKENSEKWEREYGPIYRIWAGTTPEIVLTRPEHVHQVFKDSDRHIKAENNNSGYIFSQLLGKCVGIISQDEWKTVRAISEPAFVRTAAAAHLTMMKQRVRRHFDELSRQPSCKQGLLDPALDLKMLPFWIIAEVLYGPLTPQVEGELAALAGQREALFRHVIGGGLSRFAWVRFLFPGPAHGELDRFRQRWARFNDGAYQRALQQGMDKLPIVAMTAAVAAGRMSSAHLLHTLDEILFANLDVTLGGVSWNVVFLAAYPDCQAKLRREIAEWRERAVPGVTGTAGLDAYYSSSSSYLAACIAESARLRPLAAFSVPQAAPTARVVGGYLFPAGTNFIIDSYALNQRNPFWGDTASQYRPERFLSLSHTQARYNYWRFGFGPRQCMGKYAADLILRVLLVHLVANYELALDKEAEEQWLRDPDNWINHPQMRIQIRPLDAGEYVET